MALLIIIITFSFLFFFFFLLLFSSKYSTIYEKMVRLSENILNKISSITSFFAVARVLR